MRTIFRGILCAAILCAFTNVAYSRERRPAPRLSNETDTKKQTEYTEHKETADPPSHTKRNPEPEKPPKLTAKKTEAGKNHTKNNSIKKSNAADKTSNLPASQTPPLKIKDKASFSGNIQYVRFDNGLHLTVKENSSSPAVCIRVYVKAGSIYEGEHTGKGLSHFLEHMVHSGSTEKRSENEYKQVLERLGNISNAYTTKDHTCYYITTTGPYTEEAIQVLSEWISCCTITPREFLREKEVILREIEKGNAEPRRILHKAAMRTMFREHPVKHPVIGYYNLVNQVTRDDLIAYYTDRYTPENTVVSIVGNFDTTRVIEYASRAFKDYRRTSGMLSPLPQEPEQILSRHFKNHIDVKRSRVFVGYRTVPIHDKDLYALDILSYLLTNGESSILVKELRDRQKLCDTVYSYSLTPSFNGGYFAIIAGTAPSDTSKFLSALEKAIQQLTQKPLPADLLQKAKNQKAADFLFNQETVDSQAASLGTSLMMTGDPSFDMRYSENIQNVTSNQVVSVIKKYFSSRNRTSVVLSPLVEKEKTTNKTAAAPVTTKPVKKVLPGGMTLIIKENRANPVFSIQLFLKAGTITETPETRGISRLCAMMLPRGSKHFSASQISGQIDSLGANLDSTSGRNTINISAMGKAEDFDKILEIVSSCVTAPTFPLEEIERVKLRMVADIRDRNSSWQSELINAFNEKMFHPHPYSYYTGGTEETVGKITRKDLTEYHKKFCTPSNMVMAVFGSVPAKKVEVAVSKLFKQPAGTDPVKLPQRPTPEFPDAAKEIQVPTKKNTTGFVLGFPGITVTNTQDSFALEVLDAVISGIGYPTGWLHESLRGENRGLVYVVHAFNRQGIDRGAFIIYGATSKQHINAVRKVIFEIIHRIKAEKVSPREIQKAKNICIMSKSLFNQSNSSQATNSCLNELLGLGFDFDDKYAQSINRVSAEDIQRVAQKYFKHYLWLTTVPE